MPKSSLSQYSIAELEDYLSARKVIERYENEPTIGSSPKKPTTITKDGSGKKRKSINPADVVAAIKNTGTDGIIQSKMLEQIGTTFVTFKKWFDKHGELNHVYREKKEKGPGFVYKLKK